MESRLPLVGDMDDAISEAISLGNASTTPAVVTDSIAPDGDVDMYRIAVTAGQTVDFDIDTTQNGPGGLGSFLRLFNDLGQQLATNNDAAAPGEPTVGFDAYLRFTFQAAGNYFLGVSSAGNQQYSAITGDQDTTGGQNATGIYQLIVQALPVDTNDSLAEATILGSVTTTPKTATDSISPDIDVDIYRFTVTAGETVDFDIDTAANGPGGVGSYLRIFNSQGQQLAANNDAAAPGENVIGFDAYLRFTFAVAGNYFVGVSNLNNISYDPLTGNGDTAGGQNALGDYQLIVNTAPAVPVDTDDEISEAISLGTLNTNPQTASGTITPDVDVDMYRFNVAAGQMVDFDIDTTLNNSNGLNSFLRLFNSQGQQLATNDDATAPGETTLGVDSYLRFTFATAGTFFLAVSNFNNRQYDATTGDGDTSGGISATGSYQLTAQVLPADPDDTLTEAPALGTISTTPISVTDAITPDIDVDLYRFSASAGQMIDFDIDTAQNGPGGLGSFLRLFNALGQQIAFNDDAAAPGENTTGFDAYLRFNVAISGTYYIGVSNNINTSYSAVTGTGDTPGGANSIGDYTLNVQLAVLNPADPDDAISEASPLGAISTTPVTRADSISPDTDVDLYSFTAAAGQTIDFDIDTAANGPGGLGSFLRLFNAQGQTIGFNDDGRAPGENALGFDAYLRFTFATAGTYYLGVSNNNNLLYDPLTGNGDNAGGANATGSYQLTVQALPVDTDDSISEAILLGTVSTTPVTRVDSISPDIDVDFYAFTVSAGQIVDFDIDTPTNGPGGLGSLLRLFNGQGQLLASNDDAAAPGEAIVGFDAYLRFTFAVAGTYYIGVSNNNNTSYNPLTGNGDTAGGLNSIGNYQLTVEAVTAAPDDPDDTLSEAQVLGTISTNPTGASDAISVPTDVDLFRFTATAGQIVDFDLDTATNGGSGLNSFLTLFDAQGQRLASNNNAAAPGESTIGFDAYFRFTFAATGTYYVGVSSAANTLYDPVTGNGDVAGSSNANGSYQLAVQALPADPDDTLSEAPSLGAISTNSSVSNGSISPDIDVDLYRFTAAAGQAIDFDIDTTQNGPGGLGSFLRLFNAQGQQLATNDNAVAPGETTLGFDAYLRFTFTTAGTYYIGVSNSNNTQYDPVAGTGDTSGGQNSLGSYQLIVQGVPAAVPALSLAISPAAISENGGTATGTVTRNGADVSQPLVVNLASSSPSDATVPATVTIPANQMSASFTITAVQNPLHGTTTVTITASAAGFTASSQSLLVTDSNLIWHNSVNPTDVNNDGTVSPLDALLIFNYLNTFGPGPVPAGSPPPFYDVNGDNSITPIDALIVVNELNQGGSGEGEGPSSLQAAASGGALSPDSLPPDSLSPISPSPAAASRVRTLAAAPNASLSAARARLAFARRGLTPAAVDAVISSLG